MKIFNMLAKAAVLMVAVGGLPLFGSSSLLFVVMAHQPSSLNNFPEFYESTVFQKLQYRIRSTNFAGTAASSRILNDYESSFDLKLPALFWKELDGDATTVLVSIRSKPAALQKI